jgi:hypothetical protein
MSLRFTVELELEPGAMSEVAEKADVDVEASEPLPKEGVL